MGQQTGVERGHAHEHGGFWQPAHQHRGVELRHQNQTAAIEQHDVERDEQAMDMKQRQRVQQYIVGPKSPQPMQRRGVGRQIAVSQHGALRFSGGAGGVENGGDIVGRPWLNRGEWRRRRGLGGQGAIAARAETENGSDLGLFGEGS